MTATVAGGGPVEDPVDERLEELGERLAAEAAGDPERERLVRECVAAARERFAAATVRQYLPVLVEREARERLRAR